MTYSDRNCANYYASTSGNRRHGSVSYNGVPKQLR